ncbi:uncharacterized protein EMH_0100630 [Eimeria mitis]|uniref:Uncharacterized protein n=1 Tax=Eimeria mitis TaxID=44415 RepID=U6KCT0_9EIME|nr:uncharacterized protein EMH_0100630 [Eimeria mitis]CDJ35759.1 hypothetical protein EMH_0100630 [Eimeria mitis]
MEAEAAAAASEAAVAAIEFRRGFPLQPPAAPQTRWGCLQLLLSLQQSKSSSSSSSSSSNTAFEGRNLPRLTLIAAAADSSSSNCSEQQQLPQPQWVEALEMRLALLVGRLWSSPLYTGTKLQQQQWQQQQQQQQ